LCLPKEKVTQRKGTPHLALAGEAGQFVRGGRAFRQGILPWRKGSASLPIPLRAFSSTPHRRTGGPKVKSAEPTARAAALHIASRQVALLLL
ncbi:hypothetical protein, partial [Dyella sp. AD56]|uniref:hypothetical protein n=1 Tax=Dyella sp. AD56 TaxID=1528744 RepID=UPI001E35E2EB